MKELLNPLSLENILWGIGAIATLFSLLKSSQIKKHTQVTLKKPAKKAS